MAATDSKLEEIRNVFRQFDTDEDGTMSQEEFQRFIRYLNPGMEISYIRKAFANADKNKNNRISMDEFVKWVYDRKIDTTDAAKQHYSKEMLEEADIKKYVGIALGAFYVGEIKTWDLLSGRQLKTFGQLPELKRYWLEHDATRTEQDEAPHLGAINCCIVDWEGARFLTGSADHTIKLWNMTSAQVERTFHGCLSEVFCLAADWDKGVFVSGGLASQIKVWDLSKSTALETYQNDVATGFLVERSGTKCVAADWNVKLVLCGADQKLQMWSLDSRSKPRGGSLQKPQCMKKFEGHEKAVNALMADFGRMRAISGSSDKTLRMWDLEAGTALQVWTGHEGDVLCLAGDLTMHHVVSGGSAGDIKLWDTDTGECEKTLSRSRDTDSQVELQGHADAVLSIALGPRFRFVVSTSCDGSIKLWDSQTMKCIQTIQASDERVGGVWVMDIEVEPRAERLTSPTGAAAVQT